MLVLTLAYLGYVFRVLDPHFRAFGLGDWLDPYMINALLESWCHAARTFSDPASPPMFFPATHTLGYTHGLVLFALLYVPLRAVLHPFHAHTATLLLVMTAGTLCLFALFRAMRLRFVEALLLTACFLTSPNVTNGFAGVWSQRVSVFLLPPILLIVFAAVQRGNRALAAIGGCLAALMYVQDFYTAHFALFFVVAFAIAATVVEASAALREQLRPLWPATRASRIALVVAVLAALWACVAFTSGGAHFRVAGVRVALRSWQRSALVALLAAGVYLVRERTAVRRAALADRCSVWFAVGAIAGTVLFLWIYLPVFVEHRAFPAQHLQSQLVASHPYLSLRPFILVVVLVILAWLPVLRVDRRTRLYALWLLAISVIVALAPLQLGDFSLWKLVIARIPGYGVIRDPKRIIYLYDLAVVIAVAVMLVRPARPAFRVLVTLTVLTLVTVDRNTERFDYERPITTFDRWVRQPIAIDPSCRSFAIAGGSEVYMARAAHMASLYGVDAMFIAFQHGRPTLNGYSAWAPDGWELANPQERTYQERLARWIEMNHLSNVCLLDIEARTMVPLAR